MSGFSPAFLSSTSNSFVELARAVAPQTLPTTVGHDLGDQVPEGTTIICFRTASGILMAGDRRATIGNMMIASASPPWGSTTIAELREG